MTTPDVLACCNRALQIVWGRNADSAELIGCDTVRIARAVGHPCASTRLHDRIQGRGQPACGAHPLDFPIPVAMDIRLAVGNHDEFGPAESGPGHMFEAFSRPAHEVVSRQEGDPESGQRSRGITVANLCNVNAKPGSQTRTGRLVLRNAALIFESLAQNEVFFEIPDCLMSWT